jgi:hypothetical protein
MEDKITEQQRLETERDQCIKTRWEVVPMKSPRTGNIHLGIAPRFHMHIPFPGRQAFFPRWDDEEKPKNF